MLQIGDRLPDFKLIGYDGKTYTHFDFADKYALVVIFTCNDSPIAKAYTNRLIKLFERYEEDNLAIIAINSNDSIQSPHDDFKHLQLIADRFKLEELHFLYLKDESQDVAKKFGAEKNPEVFLFNRKRELSYKGAIDDCWENEAMVTTVYLEDAIEETLDGMDIDFPETEVVGTPIIWKA